MPLALFHASFSAITVFGLLIVCVRELLASAIDHGFVGAVEQLLTISVFEVVLVSPITFLFGYRATIKRFK